MSDFDEGSHATPQLAEPKRLNVHRHFATVQVTLLSIVVALILENLLGHIWQTGAPGFNTLPDWITWLQIALVFASALTTWSGFAFGLIFIENKQINAIDFIAPFALLITMQAAIRYLYPEPLHGFLISMAMASGFAAALLFSEYYAMRAALRRPPLSASLLQMAITVWEILAAVLLFTGLAGEIAAIGFILVAFCVQTFSLWSTFGGWRAMST